MKLYESYAWLYTRFVVQNRTVAEMAREAKVSEMTIRRRLAKKGLR